ncbi:tudor domain-containing protein 7 [Drosophila ficusphila]|uniref:tudor domain-containing protein 7 n=1 Tax=Drosophila ficusphila TaxID=30025 RepID=UPI001C8A6C54|nr:tudor domain-containing protein 7 [Drosophila ficusphila]
MRAAKLDQEKILVTIANDKAPAMNGHGQSQGKTNGQGKHNGGKPPLRAILGNSAPQRQHEASSVFNTPESNFNRPLHPRVLHPGQVRSTGSSVNHRLKVKPPTDSPSPGVAPITPPASPENAQTKPAAVKAAHNENLMRVQQAQAVKANPAPKSKVAIKIDASLDAVSSLNRYCQENGFETPVFNIFNKPPRLHCSVRIDGDVYSSYPQEFADEESARQRTAQVAIQRIQHAESHQKLSACTLGDEEFIDGLYKELLKYPHGILGHKLEDWYSSTFRQHLPGHWYDLIIESKKIRVEHGIDPRIILFANDPGIPEPARISTPSILPEPQLPWQTLEGGPHDWNMFISHCDSTKQVWARLIDQIANFDELTKHMGRQMAVPLFRQPVVKPFLQEVYLVEIPDGWNRVRVISVNEEQRSCRCHFVDFGDVALFEFADLFQCPPQFLVLPAQAVCLSMYALDKFEDHPHAQAVLSKELDGQTVVAHVLTTQKQFLELGGAAQGVEEKGKRRACLVATLYDTSTAEDIHLNDLVASRITKCTPPPTLTDEKKIGKTTPILVSHINEDGDLLVLIRNEDLKFLERSIAQTVADLGEQDRVSYSDLLHDRHVFVCDESVEGQKQWFRGRLVTRPKNPEEETFDVYYVDDGRQRKTHISNIYRLEASNRALATFPPQALPVRLHDVPEIAGQMLGRLRGLMPPRCEALLKVVAKDGSKPLVNVFIRGQDPESMYMCINIGLRLEFEMASSIRPEKYDDLPLSSNVHLPRRGSYSSVVSSQSSGSDLVALTPPVTPMKAAIPRSGVTSFSSLVLKDYEAIPAVGAYFEVRVALSVNPAHFAVQPYKCYNQLQALMKDLQEHCKSPAAKGVQPSQLAIGEAYAAPDSEGVYHRVNIRKIYDEIIHVRFVDLGDDGVIACDQLKTLQPELRKLPKMALPAQLYGIQLADVVWSKDNCIRFRQLTLGQKFIGIVRRLHKQKDETLALCLELVDVSTPKDIKLHEILISEKHAQPEKKEV